MFSVTVKIRRRWVVVGLCTIAVAVLGATVGKIAFNKNESSQTSAIRTDNIKSAELPDNKARVDFLKSLGWEVNPEPSETVDIIIPQEFDKVYQRYNELQKKQGLNLEKYKGKAAKRYTYSLTNIPKNEVIVADLILYKNRLIAGDINNVAIDGFMLALNEKLPPYRASNENC